ncbi:DUF4334 domain-containing protein [Segniliparus rugosus]|uniref:GXWXG protein n=1 Tax=Segniliparus rugosus (strain ATCC BAA-974 / DSM 45345 / CCUG 50838 / CIP 108380 / JCM 13579 / CDC 945) TaxID=679197 RepID=E5XUD3_SEGRC|nr:DUF4334 domain-containing protein [Segniliparus rugosus]EFV12074.1 hypothetical protein HMPREF9336_03105 [Segniliparus rugosus ATCC BAA-974]
MEYEKAQLRFSELREEPDDVSAEELDEIWAALPTVRVEEIIGQWRGDVFNTGHTLNDQLRLIKWHGKTFVSPKEAKPLVCRDKSGQLYSNTALGKGEASLWMVEFRGETTATMVYDGQPIFDHFKKVDENTLFGIMNGKHIHDEGPFVYFALDRE